MQQLENNSICACVKGALCHNYRSCVCLLILFVAILQILYHVVVYLLCLRLSSQISSTPSMPKPLVHTANLHYQ